MKLTDSNFDDVRNVSDVEKRLASVFDENGSTLHVQSLSNTSPIVFAMEQLGLYGKFKITLPPDFEKLHFEQQIETICNYSNLTYRKVFLKDKWWTKDVGSFLAFLSPSEPVAVIYTRDTYLIYNQTGKFKLNKTVAIQLNGFAYSFQKMFDFDKATLRNLWSFALSNAHADLKRMFLFGVTISFFNLLIPLSLGLLFTNVLPTADISLLYYLGVAVLIGGITSAIFQLVRNLAILRVSIKGDLALQSGLWSRLLQLPTSFFKKYSTGDLIQRAMGIDRIRELLGGTVLFTVITGAFSIVNLCLMFYYSYQLALIALVLVVGLCCIIFVIQNTERKFKALLYDTHGFISGKIYQYINGISKIQLAGAGSRIIRQWSNYFIGEKKLELKTLRLKTLTVNILQLSPFISALVLFYFVANLFPVTAGVFIAFIAAFNIFLVSTISSVQSLDAFYKAIPIYKRLSPILYEPTENQNTGEIVNLLDGGIEISHLCFKYLPEQDYILNDISITINPGEFVAFVGESGSGKSTLLRLLLGFETPDSGSIFYDQKDIKKLNIKALRKNIGVVIQNSKLMPGSILENIIGSTNASSEDAFNAAKAIGLDKDVNELPMGFHTIISEGGGGFSGGQQQKIMIARALVNQPKVILFDEATSALDSISQEIVSTALNQLKITRIAIAHRYNTIKKADVVYVFDKGKIIQKGTPEKLKFEEGPFKKMVKREIL